MKQISQPNRRWNELLSCFPYSHVRPVQMAALGAIAQLFEDDNRFIILEAPTGAGKSALAITAARYATSLNDRDFQPGAYIVTPYNNLAAQMTDDFGHIGLVRLSGKQNYRAKPRKDAHEISESYETARARFLQSSMGVTNYAYFSRANHLPERQILILDEGHNLEKALIDKAAFRIPPQSIRGFGIDLPAQSGLQEESRIVDWLGTVFLPVLQDRMNRCREVAARREYEDLRERVTSYIDIDNRGDWIVWTEQGTLNAKPVTVSEPARELFARGKRVLIQSATIFDFATFQRILGLSNAALTFSANSDIPACNRVVIYRPVGDMAMTKMDGMLPLMCAEIARIVAEFGQYKGVIHTHSYQINQIVSQHLLTQLASHVITHNRDPYDRERAIQRHCSSKVPSILVSPCLTEGLDLKDDLARFQVVCKVPYPRLDIYTRARAMRDPQWYAFQTAWALVQMIGRAVRSDADYATTFVLDSQFEKFVRKNERILPGWWKEAVQFPARAA